MIIGLDVGGTHTDVVLFGQEGLIKEIKVPTDPADLFQSILHSLDEITSGVRFAEIRRVVLSTTLATNAIVQGQIPPVGMIVSAGPGLDPELFRTNPHYFTVSGAIDHRGREIRPLVENEIRGIAEVLKKEEIRHVGVVGKFSVRNPAHEVTIQNLLAGSFERIFTGHRIAGQLNFNRRIATAYLNTATYPIHRTFFQAVNRSLTEKGLNVPIYILKADGGTMSLESSMEFPGQTILSGPAASVIGSVAFAPADADTLVMDIGGTTTDIAVIRNRVPQLHPFGARIGGHRTLIRSLETRSIGIGGDSVVRIEGGNIRVGPERISAALAYGGTHPTPTDALFVLGKMNGGDRHKSLQGYQALAAGSGTDPEELARQVFEHACRGILAEANSLVDRINSRPVYTLQEIQEGNRIRPAHLLVMGGPASYFAEQIGKMVDFTVQVVPRCQVANAIGAALARTTCEVTLFADTEIGTVLAPEEDFEQKVGKGYTDQDALRTAAELLKKKARQMGAVMPELEIEVLERQQFNMVRGFVTTGKNIRVRVQVKPGLIMDCETVAARLAN
ncbi:MAG: hydantoinase [Deltaproteobacteria bacterium SG8_13]|nr:MAG: hydantoinase [Deltaproteobacteria bacterium SG8_13]